MAAGFTLPEVKFLSIVLRGGTELSKKVDEPHIAQQGDVEWTAAITNPSDTGSGEFQTMRVDVTLAIKVGFDVTSKNIYASFFKNDFAKYLKVRILQSTNVNTTSDVQANPGMLGVYIAYEDMGLSAQYGVMNDEKKFTEFEGVQPELAQDYATSVEIEYDESGNKIYVFPYKFQFTVGGWGAEGVGVDHLAYFAQAYIDVDKIVTDEDLFGNIQLPDTLISQLSSGEVAYQQVIQGGTTSNFSQIFYETPTDSQHNLLNFPDLKDQDGNIIGKDYNTPIWTGPVHYHGLENPGPSGYIGYMATRSGGSMGPYLTQVSIANNIIQDFRAIREIEKISFDYSLFSNSWFNQITTEKFQNNINGIKQLAGRDNPHLKDTDDIENAIIKSLSNSKNKSIFGKFYTSMDGSGNTRYAFNINMRELIKQNTAFPKLVDHIFEKQAKNFLLDWALIEELKIYRHRVYDESPADPAVDIYEEILNEDPKLVVLSKDDILGRFKPKQEYSSKLKKIVGSIKQVDIDLIQNYEQLQSGEIKFYTGTDLQTPIDGDYIYSIEMRVKDPIIEWLRKERNMLVHALYDTIFGYGFRGYVEYSKSDPEFFNTYTNRFTQKGINSINAKFGPDFAVEKITDFFQVLEEFSSFSESIYNLWLFLVTISSTNTGNPSGVETAFRVMENVYTEFNKIYSSASKYKKSVDNPLVESDSNGESVYLAAGSNPRRDFVIKHKFNTEIKGEIDHLTGYDYLSMHNTKQEDTVFANGLKSMSIGSYESRVVLETNKILAAPGFESGFSAKEYSDALASIAHIDHLRDVFLDQPQLLKPSPITGVIPYSGFAEWFEAKRDPHHDPPTFNWLQKFGYEFGSYDDESFEKAYQGIKSIVNQYQAEFISKATADMIATSLEIGGDSKGIPVLNPGDTSDFTKYTYLSPSIINFAGADSQNLLNNGQLVTDVRSLNNTLLNIIKYSTKSGQKFDFPNAPIATGVGNGLQDKIVPQNLNNELKYDLLNLMSLRQATISSSEPATRGNSTRAGGAIGGSTSSDLEIVKESIGALNAFLELSDGQKNDNLVDIFTSTKDPTSILLAATEQKRFGTLRDPRWTWEYYVENFDQTFYQEFQAWEFLKTSVATPYTSNNSPLKRAPNHVKALMLHLDWENGMPNGAYEQMKKYLKQKKEYAYNYDIPQSAIGVIGKSGDASNFFGVASKSFETQGLVAYKKIYPKNKVIYQTPEFLSFFMLNYKNIVKIEFLSGYKDSNINNPIWKELTLDVVNFYKSIRDQKNVLCRMVPYENELYGVKRYDFMNMPIYNEHFIINFEIQPEAAPSEIAERATQQVDQEVAMIPLSSIGTGNLGTPPKSGPVRHGGFFDRKNLPTRNTTTRPEDASQRKIRSGTNRSVDGPTTVSTRNQTSRNLQTTRGGNGNSQSASDIGGGPLGAPGVINYNT